MSFFITLVNVVLPVYLSAGLGFVAQKKMKLDARSLAQLTYNVLLPAFVFENLHRLKIPFDDITRSSLLILSGHLLVLAAALALGFLLRLPRSGKAALMMVSLYGNVANVGLPVIRFQYGEPAVPGALIYMLVISTLAIFVCILVAEWSKSGDMAKAFPRALFTPPVAAMLPSLLVNYYDIELPLVFLRTANLLSLAAIPSMLLAMGMQLAEVKGFSLDRRIFLAMGLKLLLLPLLVWNLAPIFGVEGMLRSTAIIQAATPSAALTSIIAIRYDVEADLVTYTVLLSTLFALPSLSVLLTLL